MNIDEFRKRAEAKNAAIKQDRLPELKAIQRESARMEVLTNSEEWNLFLSYMQAALKASERHAAMMNQRLRDPMMVNGDEIAKLKAAITMADARSVCIAEIMELPKMLMEHREKAELLIADMEKGAA